jgi:hypothetical protein
MKRHLVFWLPPPCWLQWLERMLWLPDTADSQAATWVVDLARH